MYVQEVFETFKAFRMGTTSFAVAVHLWRGDLIDQINTSPECCLCRNEIIRLTYRLNGPMCKNLESQAEINQGSLYREPVNLI
jgi:hypothetical protein